MRTVRCLRLLSMRWKRILHLRLRLRLRFVFALVFALGCTVFGGAMSEVLVDPRRSVLRSTAGAITSHPVVSTKTLRNIGDYGPMWDRRRVLLSPLGGRRFFRGTTAVSYPDDAG